MENARGAKRRATLSDGESTSILPNRKRSNVANGLATPTKRLSHREYEIGWISAIHTEFAAARALLDEEHEPLPPDPNDSNHYALGRVGSVNVAMACLPAGGMGMNNAAITASNMRRTYVSIRLILLVGIAGGVPTPANDIRLGDVVVGLSLVQHDFGKTIQDGQFTGTAAVYTPPAGVATMLSALRAQYDMRGSQIPRILKKMQLEHPLMEKYAIRDQLQDILFESGYEHPAANRNCQTCDPAKLVARESRLDYLPRIHFGTIASGNQVIKHAWTRDRIGARHGALCIEMEGAALKGLDKSFLVIRGICDYADTHKNKKWQPYAAAVAAAYTKEFLCLFPSSYNGTSDDIVQGSEPPRSITPITHELDKEKIGLILESLKFDQLNARLSNIQIAHGKTCQWLLKKQEYQDWLDLSKLLEHHGLLWMKGKPGTGKSTIMKFVLGEFSRKKKDWTVISFFFNARGEKMEKTVQGLYQSLLLQILTQFPHTQRILHHLQSTSVEWTIATLQGLLHQALESLGQGKLVCMIDALDECHPDEVRDMVHFFEDLQTRALRQNLYFRVLFASRHYPHITVRKGVELILDGQEGHEQDIVNYVGDNLNIGTGPNAKLVTDEVQQKSAGIFMWVILVVKMLNELYDEGADAAAQRKELQRIPRDLHDLLRDILLRDEKNRENMLLCIRWLLFARRPLSPVELYFAIHNSKSKLEDILLEWNPDKYSPKQINKFILYASKGLAELTRADPPTVQFIHESVNDFLLKEHGIQQVWPSIEENFKGESHEILKSCCLNCISASKSLKARLSSRPNKGKQSLDKFRQTFTLAYPFLAYATENFLLHAEAASGLGIPQSDFASDFSEIREHWVELHNVFERHQTRHYTPHVSLLYLLAERDLSYLIRDSPELTTPDACLAPGNERYGPPLLAALVRHSDASITTLVSRLQWQDAMQYDHSKQGKDLCEKKPIIVKGGRRFQYKDSIGVLAYLADYGNVHILDAVFPHVKLQLYDKSKIRQGALSWAANRAIVEFLLRNGACLDHPDKNGRTPLGWATEEDRLQTAETLLEHGAAFDATGANGRILLHLAVKNGNLSLLRTLLERGAKSDATDDEGHSPLHWAVEGGNSSVIETLIKPGAKIDATGTNGRILLHWAVKNGNSLVIETLLERGAKIDATDEKGRSPLHWAVKNGNSLVIETLLERGAKIDATDEKGRSPLHWAVKSFEPKIVHILLQNGAQVDFQDHNGRTPLSWTAGTSSGTAIAHVLLQNGAQVDLQDHNGRTPLSWTAGRSSGTAIAHVLLQNGAQVDLQDYNGRTPLSRTADNWSGTGIAQVLLQNGARVDSQDHNGRTPR
ncbi:ankyrin repeat domain-containing protein 50 [Microdochium nivale]|nr:ankyrin repeat domain-containing protein 50 [Microdochium nivale]